MNNTRAITLVVLATITAIATMMVMPVHTVYADQPGCTGICRHFSDHLPADGNAFVQVCDLKSFENPVCY